MSSPVQLRPWQRDAFEKFQASEHGDFLAVATPGAGKTTFALTCARWLLLDAHRHGRRRRLIIVAPTSHLKLQWARAAHKMGLEVDHAWNPLDPPADDVHGIVTTYQQVSMPGTSKALARLAGDAVVILDEIHHAGDERAWGDNIRTAFATAHRRLSLSGTPFRSDSASIPFVNYAATGEGEQAQADFTYGYAEALADGGVVRPVYFPRFDGLMEWSAPDGTIVSANFHDELDRSGVAHRLRTALSLDGDWLLTVLRQAHERLTKIRQAHPQAGGLVIAMDQEHARGIAAMIRRHFGVHAPVVISDDPQASARIAEFATGTAPWLVAVRMVSEGVDVPRLRVGVYATTVSTELFFRQAVGRFVRWTHGLGSQKAYVYLPDDPRLRTHAFRIAESRRHVLRPPHEPDDGDALDPGHLEHEARSELDMLPEQLSLFSVVSSTATGMSVHAYTADGLRTFDDEPDIDEPEAVEDPSLTVDFEEIPTAAGFLSPSRLSVAERKEQLREQNMDVARKLVDKTGWSYARVQAELNRMAHVTSVGQATNRQLEQRLAKATGWLQRR